MVVVAGCAFHCAPVSSAHRQQPPTDPYDDYDPYYYRKSWLVD